ncbi:hypothetical protein ACX40Y_06175 [Sphingomonas sp. RS6]
MAGRFAFALAAGRDHMPASAALQRIRFLEAVMFSLLALYLAYRRQTAAPVAKVFERAPAVAGTPAYEQLPLAA